MRQRISSWIAEAARLFAHEWRCELRAPSALATTALFAVSTLFVVGISLGPVGVTGGEATTLLPALLWIVLLFAASAGLPRAFAREEEGGTATALRLAATPSALFVGKLAYAVSLVLGLAALVVPLFLALMQLRVERVGLLVVTLLLAGYGLAAASTLVAAIFAQADRRGPLFAVLAFPVLLPILVFAVELTRAAVGAGDPTVLTATALYDAAVTVAGLMLFPTIWNP